MDLSGNVYVVGSFNSATFTFGSITLTNNGNDDIFVAKYDSNGNVLWAKSAGGNSWDEAWEVVVDNTSGSIYVSGYFDSTSISFGSFTLTTTSEDDFIAKYDNNGNVIWAKKNSIESISLDVSGNFYGTMEDNNQWFIVKYNPDGNILWAKNAGGIGDYELYLCNEDANGNMYAVGDFSSATISFGTTTLTNTGNNDILIVKYDANGNILWAKSAGGTGPDYPYSIVVDASGNVCVVGGFDSPSLSFGTFTLTNTGSHIETDDIFLVKYATDGSVLWAKSVGGTDYDFAFSIALNASGNIYMAGGFESPTITIGSITLTNTSFSHFDCFIAKLGSSNAINEISKLTSINVFPNPASNTLTINVPHHSTISIVNMQGKLITSMAANRKNTTIDISSLPVGVYFVKATTEKGVVTRKFIKE